MDAISLLIRILLGAAAFAGFIYVGVLLIRYAKTRSAGAYALGAVLILFGLGNVQDPSNQPIQQARAPKLKEEDDPGDPPTGDDDQQA